MINKLILVLFAVMMLAGTATAADYYVATWGNNASAGTLAAPWQNISNATQRAIAGDTIYLIGGTWISEPTISFSNTGNSSNYITITKYNGTVSISTYPNHFYIGHSAYSTNHRAYININNITISGSNVSVRNASNVNINDTIFSDLSNIAEIKILDNSSYVILENTTFDGSLYNSLQIQGRWSASGVSGPWSNSVSHHIYIRNSTFKNNTLHSGIDLFGNLTYITIENNSIYNINSASPGMFSHQGFLNFSNISRNRIYDVEQSKSGIELSRFDNSTIDNNTIYNVTNYGLKLTTFSDVMIRDNVITNATTGSVYVDSSATHINNTYEDVARFDSSLQTVIGIQNIISGLLANNGSFWTNQTDNRLHIISLGSGSSFTSIPVFYTNTVSNGYLKVNSGTKAFTITYYNITIQPSQNNVSASNDSNALYINYNSNLVSRLNITLDKTSSFNLSGLTQSNYSRSYSNETYINSITASSNMANFTSMPAGSYYITEAEAPASPATPATNASTYKTNTCQDTLRWGDVGFSLLIILVIVIAGGLAVAFMSGALNNDMFPIQEFAFGLIIVVILGLIGIAIMNPVITAVGCP